MIDEKKYSVTTLCLAHWLFEREVEAEESPDMKHIMCDAEDEIITELAEGLEALHKEDPNNVVYRNIHSEYMRQHPYYDGMWWKEGRPWNIKKSEWDKMMTSEPEFEDDLPFNTTGFFNVDEDEESDNIEEHEYPLNILKSVRQSLGYEEDDDTHDSEIYAMSKDDVLDAVCNWEGLINYGWCIRSWIEGIYGISLDV